MTLYGFLLGNFNWKLTWELFSPKGSNIKNVEFSLLYIDVT